MAKTKGIRVTFQPEELRDYYAYLGGQVGAIQDGAAIRDQRPSAYVERVAALRYTQDRIATALREHEAEEAADEIR